MLKLFENTLSETASKNLHSCALPTRWGEFRLSGFSSDDGAEDVILTYGQVDDTVPVLTRIHSECLTGDVFGSCKCDCGEQLELAIKAIVARGQGAIVYLRQEGRGIGLINKIRAYRLQELGADTVDANRRLGLPDDARSYETAAHLLLAVGIRRVELLTNNPQKIEGLRRHGVDVAARSGLYARSSADRDAYVKTKIDRMGHYNK